MLVFFFRSRVIDFLLLIFNLSTCCLFSVFFIAVIFNVLRNFYDRFIQSINRQITIRNWLISISFVNIFLIIDIYKVFYTKKNQLINEGRLSLHIKRWSSWEVEWNESVKAGWRLRLNTQWILKNYLNRLSQKEEKPH